MRGVREDWQEPHESPYEREFGGGGGGGPQFAFPSITPIVKLLLKINFGIFLAFFLITLIDEGAARALHGFLALEPGVWRRWFPLFPVWEILSHGFVHSLYSPWHVIWNMLQLYFFGTLLEGIIGSRRFVVTYLGAMASGGLVQLAVSLGTQSDTPVVGASGAVLGIVVAAAVLRPNTRVILILFPVLLKWIAIGVVAIDMFYALSSWRTGVTDNVAHWVHLGGAGFGFLTAYKGWIWRDPIQVMHVKRAVAQEEKKLADERRVDELLQKIHRNGISTLSRQERDFLKKVSDSRD